MADGILRVRLDVCPTTMNIYSMLLGDPPAIQPVVLLFFPSEMAIGGESFWLDLNKACYFCIKRERKQSERGPTWVVIGLSRLWASLRKERPANFN